jgi:hypothetical protein
MDAGAGIAPELCNGTGVMSGVNLLSTSGSTKQRSGTKEAFDFSFDSECGVLDGGVALAFVGSLQIQ